MLRNKELRQLAAAFALLTALASAAGFTLGPEAGLLALLTAAAFAGLLWGFTRARYARIAKLTDAIDRVLHHADRLFIAEVEEGELSILESEISKMTLRIREQNDALKREKGHLADSLADIAHQLRTPLTSASILLSLLADHPETENREGMLREAEELLVRMDWLITSLLKLSRLDAGIVEFQRVQTDVSALLHMALHPLRIPMELHNITLRMEIPEGVTLLCDPDWLAEAVRNILKNCIESAGENGEIEVSCEDTLLYTGLTIRDNGPGFAPEELPRLFDRFYRGNRPGASGYGIGLALCRTVITRQGGTVSAKNHPRGGAVFTLRFPKEHSDSRK